MSTANLVATAEWNGNKGLLSQQQAHGSDPQSFVTYTDILNDQTGRRRKRPGIGNPIQNVAAAGAVTAMHEFTKVDPATGAITYYQLRAVGATLQRWNAGLSQWQNCALGAIAFTGTNWQFVNSRNRCYAINGSDGLFYFDGTTGPDGREWFSVGCAAPSAALGYSLTAVDAPYSTGTVSVTQGSVTVNGSGATVWVTGGPWNGKYIDIAGVRYTISTVDAISPGVLTLREPYRGDTAAGVAYTIYFGLMDWSEPPQYAYSYYNSTSGHSSNISPVLQITEKDVVGRTVRLTAIPYSPADFNNGYDKIQIWRTAKDGSVLVAIDPASGGRINNSNAAGTTTFTETTNTYRDVNLTKFSAPLVSNRKPLNGTDTAPAAFSSIAEWNGRLWATAPREALLYYSAIQAEVEFGRSDECWPANNSMPVTDARGLLRIGTAPRDTLIVQTGTKDRYVGGSNILNFRDFEFSTDEEGGGFLGGALAVGGVFVELYGDKRLIDYANDEQPDIGRRIQDKLNAIPAAQLAQSRMVRYAYQDRKLLFLSTVTGASADNNVTYVYDYDAQEWYQWSLGFSAFALVHNAGVLELWAALASDKKVYKLLQSGVYRDNGADFAPAMRTAIIRPFGYGKQGYFKWFKSYVSDPAQAWKLRVYADEDQTGQIFDFAAADAVRFQSAAGKEMHVSMPTSSKKSGEVFQFDTVWPAVNADLWIEKQIAEWTLEQDVESRQ